MSTHDSVLKWNYSMWRIQKCHHSRQQRGCSFASRARKTVVMLGCCEGRVERESGLQDWTLNTRRFMERFCSDGVQKKMVFEEQIVNYDSPTGP